MIRSDLEKIPVNLCEQVRKITPDMAKNIESSVRSVFPDTRLVIDRFHVAKLVNEALQQIRIKLQWKAIEEENAAIKQATEGSKNIFP